MKSIGDITLVEIIQRKIRYCQNDTNKELITMNTGYIRGFNQVISDMNLSETEFIAKYVKMVNDLREVFDSSEGSDNIDASIDELSGYNNAIVDTLRLLDEKYLYADD